MALVEMQPTELAEIVRKIQAGDVQGLEDIHVRFGRMIKVALIRCVGRDAEDFYADVLYAVFVAIRARGMHNPAALPGFIATVARRTATNDYERRAKHIFIEDMTRTGKHVTNDAGLDPSIEKIANENQLNPEQQLLQNEEIGWMHWGLALMPQQDQDILRRFYLEGQSIEQIKAELHLTDTQLRLRKCRAKQRLVKIVGEKMKRRRTSEKPDKTENTGNVLAA